MNDPLCCDNLPNSQDQCFSVNINLSARYFYAFALLLSGDTIPQAQLAAPNHVTENSVHSFPSSRQHYLFQTIGRLCACPGEPMRFLTNEKNQSRRKKWVPCIRQMNESTLDFDHKSIRHQRIYGEFFCLSN